MAKDAGKPVVQEDRVRPIEQADAVGLKKQEGYL
jgi:hypothetical protein